MGDLVGQSLAHFRIVEKLGEGGMGVVYKAIDEKLRRTVALKVLPEALAKDEERRRRLLREARAAAAVAHPNIATVHDVGEADGRVFIAMEYLEGQSLRERLQGGALPVATALRIALQIARGLAKAHQANVVHRDLKPDNVMIGENDHVKLLDFGLAKLREEDAATPSALEQQETATELTREGKMLGTPAYMSPEQARGVEVDARSDVFAFGVVLYEMVTGERPFVGQTTQDVVTAVMRDTPKRASEVEPRVPVEIDRLIGRCLEKLRDARYANGQELVEALEGVLPEPRVSEPASMRRAPSAPTVSLLTPAASTVAPRGRGRWPWALVALLGFAAVGLGLRYRPGGTRAEKTEGVGSASGSASAPLPHATTLGDLPPPPTKVPEAATEYAAGMQALRDNSSGVALQHFERTVELDPTLTIAHLRVALSIVINAPDPARARAEFVKAAALRGDLSPRDQTLLEALEPMIQRERADAREALRRLELARERYPLDVEFLDFIVFLDRGHPAKALPASERAIELDSRDGQAWQAKGDALALLGRTEEARDAYERCADIAVDSIDCLQALTSLDDWSGRCEAFEADARRLRDRDPSMGVFVAIAMAAKGRPPAAIAEVFEQAIAATPDPELRALAKIGLPGFLATVAGDLGRAAELLRQQLTAVSATSKRTSFDFQVGVADALIELLDETGGDAEAHKIARDFAARSESWTQSGVVGMSEFSLLVSSLAVGRGGLSPEELERRRTAWVDEQRTTAARYPGLIWTYGYAAPAITAEEAQRALAAMQEFAPLTSHDSFADAYTGRAYLLAGRPGEALPYLKRAAAHCDAIVFIPLTRASLWLGQALEATGDHPGACAAYKVVLDRWGHAKPRSVTADKARERVKALACPHPSTP